MSVVPEDSCDASYFPCVEACESGALSFAAKMLSSEWLLEDMLQDKETYLESGGGLTLSGGEPLLARAFSQELLASAKSHGFHTALDTSGALDWAVLEEFLDLVDLWIYDVKHLPDPATGPDPHVVNLMKLVDAGATVWVRVALVPGHNDTEEAWASMAEALSEAGSGLDRVLLLPCCPQAKSHYEALGRVYDLRSGGRLPKSACDRALAIFRRQIPETRFHLGSF